MKQETIKDVVNFYGDVFLNKKKLKIKEYKIKTGYKIPPIPRKYTNQYIYLFPSLIKQKKELNKMTAYPENFQKKRWDFISRKTDISSNRYLTRKIKEEYNGELVTNAWLKIFELLNHFNLINLKDKTINTFSICESPGAWISAINHYITSNNSKSKKEWHAQSLNPYYPGNYLKWPHLLKDMYGLLAKYKDNYLFGEPQTGDITDSLVIKSYIKSNKLKDIDLITADCGVDVGEYWYEKELRNSKVAYGQIMTGLALLKKNKNMIYKTYAPFTYASTISVLFLLSCSFNKLYLCKPQTSRPHNEEIYVVCLGYKDNIKKQDINKLINLLDDYDVTRGIFLKKDIPKEFLNEIEKFNNKIIKRQIKYTKRTILYYDNIASISQKHFNFLDNLKEVVAKRWIKKNNLEKIDKKDRIMY